MKYKIINLKYAVNRYAEYAALEKWVAKYDNSLLEMQYECVRDNHWGLIITANRSGEMLLLLQYGHIVEKIS